jgi:hypothetical protein
LRAAGLGDQVQVASAGTSDWHVGKAPDKRSQQAALRYILGNRAYSAANPNPVQPDHSLRRSLARIVGDLPGARRIFNPGFLTPWSSFALPNLVILRKNVEDSRHWTHHVPF